MPTDAKLLGHKKPGRSTFIEDNFDKVSASVKTLIACAARVAAKGRWGSLG